MSFDKLLYNSSSNTLFKAISKLQGDWICGYIIEAQDSAAISSIGNKRSIEYEAVIPDTICQITPLKTINNEAIFEYDVILYEDNEYYVLCCSFPCWYYIHLISEDNVRFKMDSDMSKYIVPNPHIDSKVQKIVGNFKDIAYPSRSNYREFSYDSKTYIS